MRTEPRQPPDEARIGPPCPACGSVDREHVLSARDFDRGVERFDLERCRSCGLVRTSPTPTEDELGRCYAGGYYGGGDRKFVGPIERLLRHAMARRARALARRARPDGSPGSILDVGCGRGTLLRAFVERGWEAHGVERDDFPSEALPEGARIHRGRLWQLGLDEAGFDLVVFWHVLEHLDDPAQSLRESARLLRPGGLLVVSVPDFGGVQARLFGADWMHLDLPRHLWHFDGRSLEALLRRAGLDPCARSSFAFEQDTFGFVQSLLNKLSRGRPNRLYARLEGERVDVPWWHVALAVAAAPVAVLEHVVSGALGRGATVTMRARPVNATPSPGAATRDR